MQCNSPPNWSVQELELVGFIGVRAGPKSELHSNVAVVQDCCHRADFQVRAIAGCDDLHAITEPQFGRALGR